MIKNVRIIIALLVGISLLSCNNRSDNQNDSRKGLFQHAKNIYSNFNGDSVTIYFSWNNSRDSIVYQLSQIQAERIAVLSTTDIAMLAEMGEINRIAGVCDPFRISNKEVQKRIAKGKIKNVGTSMEINAEALAALNPDLIITSAYSQQDIQNFGKLKEKLGDIPVIFTMGWQENTPFARCEWIKLYGLLTHNIQKADSIFSAIEQNYSTIKNLTDSVEHKPLVLAGAASNDIWYMPGGKSYVAQFIADAGGNYIWKDDQNTGSVVVNFEQVLQASQKADLWIGCDEKTLSDLYATNKNYTLLNVFKKGEIYHRSKRLNENGGNDYWEYGYVRPDIVLSDYMKAIHPELLPDYETVFLEKVRE